MPNGFDYNDLLYCAGSRTGEGSICKGDSGGCLAFRKEGTDKKDYHYQQLGITQGTFNTNCEVEGRRSRFPGIFTSTKNTEINNFIRTSIGLAGAYISEKQINNIFQFQL